MNKSLKDIRIFVIRQILETDWSSEGRSNYYTNSVVSFKKDFDSDFWVFSFDNSSYHTVKSIGINKYIFYILLFLMKRSDKKRKELQKTENIRND